MIKECGPCLDLVVLESRVEEVLEGGWNGLTHVIMSETKEAGLRKEEWAVDRSQKVDGGWGL